MEKAAKFCSKKILSQKNRPLFVAVTGDSGSGKSYLVGLIAKQFDKENIQFTLINHDDFLISRQDREPMKLKYYSNGEHAGKS